MNTTANRAYSVSRLDGVYNTDPYAFIEDMLRSLLANRDTYTERANLVATYQEIVNCFYVINSQSVEVLSHFRTVSMIDTGNLYYRTKTTDLETMVSTAFNLFLNFQALVDAAHAGRDNDLRLSEAFAFACLTACQTLKNQIRTMQEDRKGFETTGFLQTQFITAGVHHPSAQFLNSEGFTTLQ